MVFHAPADPWLPRGGLGPLLPRGEVLFGGIPVHAVILPALASAVGCGVISVNSARASATILVEDGQIEECHLHTGTADRSGYWVLDQVRGWSDGSVWGRRLDPATMDMVRVLLLGEPLYEDLRLEWTDLSELLHDLEERGGVWTVEVDTPSGRHVIGIDANQRILSFSDQDGPDGDGAVEHFLGDIPKRGRVRVRGWPEAGSRSGRGPGVRSDASSATAWAGDIGDASAAPAASTVAADPRVSSHGSAGAAQFSAEELAQEAEAEQRDVASAEAALNELGAVAEPGAEGTVEEPGWVAPDLHAQTVVPTVTADSSDAATAADGRSVDEAIAELLPDVTWVAPWDTHWRPEALAADDAARIGAFAETAPDDGSPAPRLGERPVPYPADYLEERSAPVAGGSEADGHASGAPRVASSTAPPPLSDERRPDLADLLFQMRDIAERRLRLSARRVDVVLQSALAQQRPVDEALRDVRGLTIRGVMPETIAAMVDEMEQVAGRSTV